MSSGNTGAVDQLDAPDASYEALSAALSADWSRDNLVADSIRAVAAPVVAAELRRIADLDPSWTICGPATFLRARADELDPPTSKDA